MAEQTSILYDSFTALNRAMLLKPSKDDSLLASIIQDSTLEFEGENRATVWYSDPETGQKYGLTLSTQGLKERCGEEQLRKMAAPDIWHRVTMGRVTYNGKKVRKH